MVTRTCFWATLFAASLFTTLARADREPRHITVFAAEETRTDVKLRRGETVSISASGRWKMGSYVGFCGPDGFSRGAYASYSRLSGASHGALLAKCGTGSWKLIGSSSRFTADEDADLVFCANDTELGNNGGSLSVTIADAERFNEGASNSAERTTKFTKTFVAAATGGTSTIRIEKGDRVQVTASGAWKMGDFIGSCGPDGIDNAGAQVYNLFPSQLHGKLALKVEGGDGWYVVGSSGDFVARKSGYLAWTPNDNDLTNNSGALTVKVSLTRRIGNTEARREGEQVVTVRADSRATNTGIRVRRGQSITIKASGTWRMGPFVGDCNASGMSFVGDESFNRFNSTKHGTLMATLNPSGGWIAAGISTSFRADETGELIFAPNDNEVANNSGSLVVTVRVAD